MIRCRRRRYERPRGRRELLSYEEARIQIESGDVVFIHGSKFRPLQYITMYFTDSPFAHVGLAFWMLTEKGDKRLMMVEAQGGARRRIINMSSYRDRKIDVVRAPCPWNEISDQALARLGKAHYGWIDAIYVGIREKLARYIRLPTTHFSGEICSEYIARILKLPKVHISPQRLYDELHKLGFEIKLKVRRFTNK